MADRNRINEAVVAQFCEDMRNGQLHRCSANGFPDEVIERMKIPEVASALADAPVQWCLVTPDPHTVANIVNAALKGNDEVILIDRYLRAGASTEQISSKFGLTHREVAMRRQILGLEGRKGRPAEIKEEEEILLWQAWSARLNAGHINPANESELWRFALEHAEEHPISLASAWAHIQSWIRIGRG